MMTWSRQSARATAMMAWYDPVTESESGRASVRNTIGQGGYGSEPHVRGGIVSGGKVPSDHGGTI